MMIREREALIDTVRSYFAFKPECKVVLVFGSVASGRLGDSSDVDIAIAGDSAFGADTVHAMGMELSVMTGRPVDIVDLVAAEGLIIREALVRGIKIKLDRSLFVRLHTRMITDREDFLPLKRAMQRARIERFVYGS